MFSVSFGLIGFFILVVGGFIFFGAISTLLGHRKIMNQVTEQVFRQARQKQPNHNTGQPKTTESSGEYSCSHCGASLSSDTEISPGGDFKCGYCNSWSNVSK